MANRCAVLFTYGLFLWRAAATAQDGEHYSPCLEGWVRHGASCYRYNDTAVSQTEASETCHQFKGHLVYIDDDNENNFVQGFLNNVATAMWLGARYVPGYHGWFFTGRNERKRLRRITYRRWTFPYYSKQRLEEESCAKMDGSGSWDPEFCLSNLPFLCEKPPPCEVGWYGEDCRFRCHCHGSDSCGQEDGLCPRGCSPGWTGSTCNTKNAMPEASYHCLRTIDDSLRADLAVDAKSRSYREVQAVSQEGEPLSCRLPFVRRKGHNYYVTLLLPGAFTNSSSGVNATDTNVTDSSAGGVQTSSSTPVDATSGSTSAVTTTRSSPPKATGQAVTNSTVTDSGAEIVRVATDESEGDGGNVTAKRDVSADAAADDEGGDCVATRSGNGTVTWLIEFKQFQGVTTGNDVTVEVTCELDEADNLELLDSVYDDSDKEDSLLAAKTSVMTSVYLADAFSGKRHDRFHLGQTLQLHVDVEGLMSNECAFPHSCVVKPKGAQGKSFPVLDKNGCPLPRSPITVLRADGSGHFTSNDFPAFSLGSTLVLLDCQVDVVYSDKRQECRNTCRSSS